MRVVLCVTILLCGTVNCGLVPAPLAATLIRAPKYDSAIIQSDRLGGNFAYSTAESHAYAVVSPIVEHVVKPVAVSYTAQQVIAPVAIAPQVISTSVIGVPPVISPVISAIPPAVLSVPQIVSNVVESTEVTDDSTSEAAENPAEETATEPPAESQDTEQAESS